MTLVDWWNKLVGAGRSSPQSRTTMTPSTLQAELANRRLNRPIVFDPALRQFTAHRAGEPSFQSEEEQSLWHSCRMTVLHHILHTVSQCRSHKHLLLRGSTLMVSWFAERARRPGDLDWVVMPPAWTHGSKSSRQLLADILGVIEGSTIREDLVIPPNSHVLEEIWTYERAPGVRVIVPWQHSNAVHNGTVQMDFVFGEKVPTPPVTTLVAFGGFVPIPLQTASPEQSLAWKLLWLATDSYALGKDLYDAVLLAEAYRISAQTLIATFKTVPQDGDWALKHFQRETVLGWHIEWDDFIKEYPDIDGTGEDWRERLAVALQPLFSELELHQQDLR